MTTRNLTLALAAVIFLTPLASGAIVFPEPRHHAEAGRVHVDLWNAAKENGWRSAEKNDAGDGGELVYIISWPPEERRPGFEIRLVDTTEPILITRDHWRVEPDGLTANMECPGRRRCDANGLSVAPASGTGGALSLTFELKAWEDPASGTKAAWNVRFEVPLVFEGEGPPTGSEWYLFTPVNHGIPETAREQPEPGVIAILALTGAATTLAARRRRRAERVPHGPGGP